MKGLMAKLKGMPLKRMLVAHGEKVVLGMVGLIVLMALATTTWGGYQKQPEELLTKATAAGAALTTGNWPEEKQQSFKPSTYQTTAEMMFEELNVPDAPSVFSYDKPMSFPIYARQEPRSEPEFSPPQQLIADATRIVLGVNPPEPTEEELMARQAEMEAGPLDAGRLGATAKGAKAKKGKKGAEMEDMAMMPGRMMEELSTNTTGLQPRGQRMVALRGIVNLYDIGMAIQKALHLATVPEGMALVEVVDFKIQRQKAVSGPNPWPEDTWQDVSLDRAAEVLSECGQAADIVTTECINPVFTMPLPTRLDGDYTRLVGHPSLEKFELTKEQREMEQKLNAATLDEAEALGLADAPGQPKGFLRFQVDINQVRNEVLGQGRSMGDLYKRAGMPSAPAAGGMMPAVGRPGMGMGAGMPGRPGGAMMPGMPMAGGMGGPGGMMGMQEQLGHQAAGYLALFRYLDFDVNPGEAYRYRVRLEFINPNFGMSLDSVKEAAVAEGETRMTPWSEPSAPVVVQPDSNVFLADVDRRNNRNRGEAKIHAFQWDPSLGTYIDSKLAARFGQFLGGLVTSVSLDLGVPAYEEKEVLIATKDFLLDTSVPPEINPAENPDLNLPPDTRQSPKRVDLPAEAIVLDEYGQLKILDSISDKPAEAAAEKKVQEERAPWEYLKESAEATTNSLDDPAAMRGEMMMPGMPGPKSALKRGRSAGRGAGAGAGAGGAATMPSPAGMPGGGAGRGRRGGR